MVAISARLLRQLNRPALELRSGILVRRREIESQTGPADHQRQENVRGAFLLASPEGIQDKDVLLVDVVLTTGATVNECARVLRRQQAKRVFVATVARVLKAEATWAIPEEIEKPRALAAYA